VTATDYACKAIEILKRDYPEINWSGGDFLSLDFPENHYDIVTCVETIAHVPDQAAFAQKIANSLRRGGTLLLTTQNEYIWSRTRSLAPPGEGQIRNWPTRDRLLELFSPRFKIEELRTCAPGGDRGLPRLLNNRISRAVGRGLFGQARWLTIWESMGFGRSLFLVGTRL
jgi:SAM-dependent methyltransferase